jgi:acyl-CoA synthetase (AMP-forming)/AMP-acid ligase II
MPTLEEIEAQLTGPGGPFEVVQEPVLGEVMPVFKDRHPNLRAILQESVGHGDREYIVLDDLRISFAEHARIVASVAKALRERFGVEKGDRVAILAANCPEWVFSFWAAISLGAIPVGLNGWWAGDEILYGVSDSDPRVLIGDRKRLARIEPTISKRRCPTPPSTRTTRRPSSTPAAPRAGPRGPSTRIATSSPSTGCRCSTASARCCRARGREAHTPSAGRTARWSTRRSSTSRGSTRGP